ncbi:D-alanine--D-alanine ligase family protein [Chryseosolibacter indicus]|uniref:D-alanine--D-alanine ligase n=1 Tax=Chryseosolibacter indicus TaxID=2782351 RepID=A0ABS5VXP1_9BACT|nr:D-alanine--D-alanine ligase family protein [Chryseosolibacter indicus]MBT1706182.1 D-alanine--D-alanine ligase [Chryseosolibacter indicus]
MSKTKKVAILYGGRSVEHGVSVNSARNIFEYINKDLFEPLPIGISKTGQWFLTSGVTKDIEQGKALGLILDAQRPGFTLLSSGDRIKVDIIFPVLHGTDGEDGSIQGLIKAMDIPMVGTGVLGSSMSMNKIVAKRLLKEAGIPVTNFVTFHYTEKDKISFKSISEKIGVPFMVKSASLGSSVGVSKVKDEETFKTAVDEAFRYDDYMIAEEFVVGREIECAILGNHPPQASYPGEVVINSKYEFYTFDAKYVDPDAVKIELPAKLEPAEAERIRELSVKAYEALSCEDFSRVDLFLTQDGKIYINEINTIPGFTNSSMYPMMWKERGIGFTDLISRLLELAQERYDRSKRIERDFNSALKF